jgi:osmotically inducible protein OsmC
MSLDIVYTAAAHATGGGRDGHVRSEDDRYAACFLGALHAAGKELEVDTTGAEVSAEVGIGGTGDGAFGLAVELDVYAPNAPQEQRQRLAERAHEICPYSNATRGNITVTLSIVD